MIKKETASPMHAAERELCNERDWQKQSEFYVACVGKAVTYSIILVFWFGGFFCCCFGIFFSWFDLGF